MQNKIFIRSLMVMWLLATLPQNFLLDVQGYIAKSHIASEILIGCSRLYYQNPPCLRISYWMFKVMWLLATLPQNFLLDVQGYMSFYTVKTKNRKKFYFWF